MRPAGLPRRHDLSAVPAGEWETTIERVADEVHASFDLATGPLLTAVLYDTGPGRTGYLFLAGHHLVIDAVSWRILLADLDTALQQLGRQPHRARWRRRQLPAQLGEKRVLAHIRLVHEVADQDLRVRRGRDPVRAEQAQVVQQAPVPLPSRGGVHGLGRGVGHSGAGPCRPSEQNLIQRA